MEPLASPKLFTSETVGFETSISSDGMKGFEYLMSSHEMESVESLNSFSEMVGSSSLISMAGKETFAFPNSVIAIGT
jgi:hypothetical protein